MCICIFLIPWGGGRTKAEFGSLTKASEKCPQNKYTTESITINLIKGPIFARGIKGT